MSNPTLGNLNLKQCEAVDAIISGGPVLILAGAGTGKTTTLIACAASVLESKGIEDWQIVVLTFTNKAAKEIKDRIFRTNARNLSWAGTFHSVCLRILRRHYADAGLCRDFLIFGENEQKNILKTVILALGMDIKEQKPSDWVEKISRYKDMATADEMPPVFNKIYAAYNSELERLGGIDFADIINRTVYLFSARPDILEKYQRQFKYVLVDEYQDTNAVQNRLLKMLAAGHGNICCVGDDDQSIYSWRGAEIKNILNFPNEYPNAKVIRLEENYRSTGNILGAANSLIKNNAQRLGKDLHSNLGDGDKVKLLELCEYGDVARLEAKKIADEIESSGKPLSDFAILIRSGSLSRPLEEELAKRQISHRLIGAMKFYDRAEIRDVIAYARLLCFPFDDLSFKRIIGSPKRGIGDATINLLEEYARKNKLSLLDALKNFSLKPKQSEAAKEFLDLFNFDWRNMPTKDAVLQLLDKSGYLKMWKESKDLDKDDRLRNIYDLADNVIANFDSLPEFLEQAALMTSDDERDVSENSVSIMTIHAAKGLEFDTVFLPAWQDGIFPHRQSIDEGNIEEERRLAYVAITRAKRHCFIFYGARAQFGELYYKPSRFIDEIDRRFVSKCGAMASVVRGFEKKKESARLRNSHSIVGKLASHSEMGKGVVIEDGGDILTIAFRDRGIKKVDRRFVAMESD
ncbi:MAG: UvrD-helicase domain-containing protein [Rickettsiales bacterium]|nr:UvrD-helicase domain-containing protein [Rickettsiales bacterium]